MSSAKRRVRHDTKKATHATHTDSLRRSRHSGGLSITIVLTGLIDDREHLVYVNATEVWLSGGTFDALSLLISSRLRFDMGAAQVDRLVVLRLRRKIDGATHLNGVGKRLIHAVSKGAYRLMVDREAISIDDTFVDLECPKYIDPQVKEYICRACRERKRVKPR